MSETTPTTIDTTVCRCSHARSSHNHDRLACKECAEVGKTCRQFIPGNRLGDVAPVRSAEDPLTIAATYDVIPEITEKHRAFLESRGYIVETIEDAKSFVAAMIPEDRASFFAGFALYPLTPGDIVQMDSVNNNVVSGALTDANTEKNTPTTVVRDDEDEEA